MKIATGSRVNKKSTQFQFGFGWGRLYISEVASWIWFHVVRAQHIGKCFSIISTSILGVAHILFFLRLRPFWSLIGKHHIYIYILYIRINPCRVDRVDRWLWWWWSGWAWGVGFTAGGIWEWVESIFSSFIYVYMCRVYIYIYRIYTYIEPGTRSFLGSLLTPRNPYKNGYGYTSNGYGYTLFCKCF